MVAVCGWSRVTLPTLAPSGFGGWTPGHGILTLGKITRYTESQSLPLEDVRTGYRTHLYHSIGPSHLSQAISAVIIFEFTGVRLTFWADTIAKHFLCNAQTQNAVYSAYHSHTFSLA